MPADVFQKIANNVFNKCGNCNIQNIIWKLPKSYQTVGIRKCSVPLWSRRPFWAAPTPLFFLLSGLSLLAFWAAAPPLYFAFFWTFSSSFSRSCKSYGCYTFEMLTIIIFGMLANLTFKMLENITSGMLAAIISLLLANSNCPKCWQS